jgi:hypothetical protein
MEAWASLEDAKGVNKVEGNLIQVSILKSRRALLVDD